MNFVFGKHSWKYSNRSTLHFLSFLISHYLAFIFFWTDNQVRYTASMNRFHFQLQFFKLIFIIKQINLIFDSSASLFNLITLNSIQSTMLFPITNILFQSMDPYRFRRSTVLTAQPDRWAYIISIPVRCL